MFPYRVITHYENMHLTKPRPEYVAEIPGLLGLAVFHLGEPDLGYPGGDLRQAAQWLPRALQHTDAQAASTPPALMALLRGHAAALHTITTRFDPASRARRSSRDDLTPNETLCHLRDVEAEVHLPRIRLILRTSEPFLRAIDTDRWIEERNCREQDGLEAFHTSIAARDELLRHLQSLDESDWQGPARHSLLGPTTLAEMVRVITDHDRHHLASLRLSLPQARVD